MNKIINTSIIFNDIELNIKISTIITISDEILLTIDLFNGLHNYVNKTNINELLVLFDDDINTFFDELNDMIKDNSFKLLYDNDIYDIIFIYTISKKRQKEFSFKCMLNENENTITNTITYLNNKINKMDYQIKQLIKKLNVYEQCGIDHYMVNLLGHMYNGRDKYTYLPALRYCMEFHTPRKFKYMVGYDNLFTNHWEPSFISTLHDKSEHILNGTIDSRHNALKDYFDSCISQYLWSHPLNNNIDKKLFFDKCKVVIQYNGITYTYNWNDSSNLLITFSEQLKIDIKEQTDNPNKYYPPGVIHYIGHCMNVPYAINNYYLLTNVKDNGIQYKLNKELCDEMQVNFDAIAHLYRMEYIN